MAIRFDDGNSSSDINYEKLITLTDVCNSYICKYQLKLPLDVLINNLPEQQLIYTKQSKLKVVKLIELNN